MDRDFEQWKETLARNGGPPLIGSDLDSAAGHADSSQAFDPQTAYSDNAHPGTNCYTDPDDATVASGERRVPGARCGEDPPVDVPSRPEQHAVNASPADPFAVNIAALTLGQSSLAVHSRRWFIGPPARAERQRDLFPLPPAPDVDSSEPLAVCTNGALCALDFLNDGMRVKRRPDGPTHVRARPTRAQAVVHEFVRKRCGMQLERLATLPADTFVNIDGAFGRYEPSQAGPGPVLAADKVDLPKIASTCIAEKFLAPTLAATVASMDAVMPAASPDSKWPTVSIRDRDEYLKLIALEVEVGKVRLMFRPRHVAGRFVVGKRDTGRQRPVWNGSTLSEAAHAPPMPRRLANPACLPHIRVKCGDRLFFSKRDAASFFDALQAPTAMRSWFGCPGVKAGDLARTLGTSLSDLSCLCDDFEGGQLEPNHVVYPCITSWPMGFSWSSAIAQDVSVSALLATGLAEEYILSDLHPLPECHNELALIATDDTILIHTDRDEGLKRIDELEGIFKLYGIPQRVDKDETVENQVTAIGCFLTNDPPRIEPALDKLANVLCAIFDLHRTRKASPLGLAALLGVMQWLALMSRPFLSIFDQVYIFPGATRDKRSSTYPTWSLTSSRPLPCWHLCWLPTSPVSSTRCSPRRTLRPVSASVLPFVLSLWQRRLLSARTQTSAATSSGFTGTAAKMTRTRSRASGFLVTYGSTSGTLSTCSRYGRR